MNIEKIKRRKTERKDVVISVRATKSQSEWMKKMNYAPNGIFQEALLDLQKAEKK